MKNYKDSDYALNKYSEGIVYRFVDGIVEITLADYLAENPEKTEADFNILRELSRADYFEQDRSENAQTKMNTPFDELDESMLCCVPAAEEMLISEIVAQEEAGRRGRRLETAQDILDKLTDVQRRRYLLYHIGGLSTWKIAKLEGVNQSKIVNSLTLAEKKIKKLLAGSKK